MSTDLSSLDEMHVRRFERARADEVAARLRRLRTEDPPSARLAAKQDAKVSMGDGDVSGFVGACEAWRELQPLPAGYNGLFARALIAEERFEAAYAALTGAPDQPQDGAYFHDLALALTGMGRLAAALGAAVKAQAAFMDRRQGSLSPDGIPTDTVQTPLDRAARWPTYRTSIERQLASDKRPAAAAQLRQFLEERAQILLAALTRAATAQAGARAPADWAGCRRLIEAYLLLGLARPAADGLIAALRKPMALGEGGDDAAFALAAAAAPRLDAPTLAALAQALAPICRSPAEQAAVERVAAALRQGVSMPEPAAAADAGRVRVEVRAFLALACAAGERFDMAVDLLGRLADRQRQASPYLPELARCVGRETAPGVRLEPQPRAPRRIFDLFPYNGEQRVLEIKLNEMSDWVDRFVIVESRQTFAGLPKPLYFELERERFASWAHRIEHVVVDAFPGHVTSAWARAFHQRDQAVRGIAGVAAPDDLVLLTDVDEIVDRRAVEPFTGDFAGLQMQTFRYFLNYRRSTAQEARSGAASIWKARHLQEVGSSYARQVLAPRLAAGRIADAGWRFTAVADPQAVASAIPDHPAQAAAVRKAAAREQTSLAGIVEALKNGRFEPGWERWEVDERFPDFVRRNRQQLSPLIL